MEHKEAVNEPVTAPGSLSKPEKPGVPQEKSVAGNKKTAIAVIAAIVLACVLLAVALGILISRLSRIDWKTLLNDTDPDSVQVTNSAKTESTGNRMDEQGDMDLATLQWIYAANAFAYKDLRSDYIGGMNRELISNITLVKEELEKDWGVSGRSDLLDKYRWLLEEGHRTALADVINEIKRRGWNKLDTETFDGEMEALEDQKKRKQYIAAYLACTELGELQIAAWDYTRALLLIDSGYIAGYIRPEEYLSYAVPVARLIQETFPDWPAVYFSAYCGSLYSEWKESSLYSETAAEYGERYQDRQYLITGIKVENGKLIIPDTYPSFSGTVLVGDEPGETKPADTEPDDPDSLALQAKDAEDWMKVAGLLRNDFIAEDAVFLDSELVSQDWYEVSLKYFFPSFQETSSVGCGYLVQIHNRSQYKHAFIFDCYQANSWMIEGSDIVEINGYESKTVFLCLDEMYVRTVTVRHAIESIGFRLMIRPGGYSGANNMFDEFFSFLLNGRGEPKRLNVPEGPIVFDDKGILVVHTYSNLDSIETSEPYISTSYFIRNNNDYPLDVKLFGYIDGCYVGQIDTDDHRIVTAQCDLFGAGVAINKPKLDRAGIEIQDGIKNFSVRMVVEACPGYVLDVPEEPLLDTTFVIFEAGGKT